MRPLWFLLVFAGCQSGSPAGTDTPDAPDDGTQPRRGLFITWRATPALPGPIDDKLTVTDAAFQLDHFQVTSDSGSANTTRSRFVLAWDAGGEPGQDEFPDAPAGVYSKVSLAMLGGRLGDYAYHVDGTWRASDGTVVRYEIRDRQPLIFGFNCDEMLVAGGSARLTISLDLKEALGRIEFDRLWDEESSVIEIDDGPELMGFRDRLKRAFRSDRDDGNEDD
jgi:hypothetical protein